MPSPGNSSCMGTRARRTRPRAASDVPAPLAAITFNNAIRSRQRPSLPPHAGEWPLTPSSPSTPNFCARPPIIRCCASHRWRSPDEAVVVDALAPGIDLAPFFSLMADEKVMKVFHAARQDIEIVWHRRQAHSASDLRYPGRRHGARLRQFDLLRPARAAHHRRRARQIAPLHRLDAAAAVRCAALLCHVRRDAFARRLSRAGRRPRAARPRRLGAGRDAGADVGRHLPHGSGECLAAAEDPRAQAEGARRADRGRGLARARGAGARRAALAGAQGRRDRRHRRAGADHDREARKICVRCPRASNARAGAKRSSRPWRAGWRATRKHCRICCACSRPPTAPRWSSCSRCCCA